MIQNNSVNYDTLYLIFVFSIGSTLFTALRFTNIPIGIGELILLVLGIYMIINNYKDLNYNFFKNSLLLKFWIISFVLLLAGFLISFFLENILFYKSIFHDTLAYIFIFYLLIIMHLFEYKIKDHIVVFEKFIYFSLIFYTILFTIFVCFEVLTFNKSYSIIFRYLGLSSNPNQIAILFTIKPFIFIYFYKTLKKEYFFSYTFLIILLSLVIGKYVNSEALFLGWFFALCLYVFLIYITRYSSYKINIFLFAIVSIIFLFIILNLKEIIYFIDGGPSSADVRIKLIFNAFIDISKMFYFGFGPGGHSFINLPINEGYSEVHNTFIDWFTQTGILGLLLYFYLIYKIIKGLYIKKELILISAFSSLLIFSTFHFTFRQPIFWFFIFFFYIMSQGDKKCVE
ncbi:O-antigen ligase family protein [Aliarcobacter cryaerophilus]|uniref:O-antigen ligase family protein n=1 Tax=Aliarcobacter cryaerophilus TaxID=28198 RepID=UPI00082FBA4D|nr:O-antigen ligase family protein [Aliarcobacter cryaerophilus]